ncbi:MAG: outer membrane protein assembly factor BamA [Candidatus Aminicenantes bacterium]|nr:outer membrane protein assembly factor BamA [Candidatus Aminicenantes bacterium]
MKKLVGACILILLLVGLAHAENIDQIEIRGNQKVSRDTILFYMKSSPGGPLSQDILLRDFRSLWDTGFFSNIRIELEQEQGTNTVIVTVEENRTIASITYDTGKKIKQDAINEKLQENNIVLSTLSYFDPAKVKRVERIITDLMVEKGYNNGKVNVIARDKGKDQVDLTIKVEPGPKTRIGAIVFSGLDRKKLSPRFLRKGLKNNKPHGLFSAIGGKDVYDEKGIQEDLENIRERMQQKGFLEAKVGTPEFSLYRRHNLFGKIRKMLRITIPVELGPRYRLGEVQVQGNKIIRSEFLKNQLKMDKGDVFNIKKRNDAIEAMRKLYYSLGYFYCQVVPTENLDPIKKVADLTFTIQENDIVYLGRLEFVGNTFTKDHVIRREWFLREGYRLNINLLEDSIRRMKQLGLVTVEKMPEIKPDAEDPQKINLLVEVQELNRQSINFNVGFSGYDGLFIAAGYSTQNFLGMGETFALSFQQGTRSKNYRFAFTEPWLFNSPASLGIEVYRTSYEFPALYTQHSEGFNISTSTRFWRYWGASLVYSLQRIEISDIDPDLDFSNPYSYYYYTGGKRTLSSLSPTIYYSTVDSPIFPRSGTKYLANYRYSGGFLGGDIDLHKVKLEFVKFTPLWKRRHTLGLHLVYQFIHNFGENAVPFYERYFLGGERSIRGYEIYTIGPRSSENNYIIGGTKAFFINAEYSIPLNEQVSFVAFYDVGNSYDTGVPISLDDVYRSMGVEVKVFVPMLNVPFRLIFSHNSRLLREDEKHFVFRFAVGPSFH